MSQGGAQASNLPSREHLRILREFLLGRTRLVVRDSLESIEEPLRGDVLHSAEALYQVVNILSRRVLDAVYEGRPNAGASSAWGELLIIANVWREFPGLPIEVRELIDQAFMI